VLASTVVVYEGLVGISRQVTRGGLLSQAVGVRRRLGARELRPSPVKKPRLGLAGIVTHLPLLGLVARLVRPLRLVGGLIQLALPACALSLPHDCLA
jgi:hypothetical protein